MNVYTYYDTVPRMPEPIQQELISFWKDNWRSKGWNPVVLSQDDACMHPDYPKLLPKFIGLPTINTLEYELSCYLRWLAVAHRGGGVMTDYDVVNFAFPPEALEKWIKPNKMTLFERWVPCVVAGEAGEFLRACYLFSEYRARPDDKTLGRSHVSDMIIIEKCRSNPLFNMQWVVKEFGDVGWQQSPLVHFSGHSSSSHDRRKIETIMQESPKHDAYHHDQIGPHMD